jgi:hypothetical protein
VSTHGIDGVLVETHNWGKSVAFWQGLGFVLELETDHRSGRLRHPDGGPYIFIAERPPEQPLQIVLGLRVDSAARCTPPRAGRVKRRFARQHWGSLQMLLADPDGRVLGIEAPAPKRARTRRKPARTPTKTR